MAEEIIHEVRKSGNLYFLFNAALGAYNRRTDAIVAAEKDLAKWLAVLASALTNDAATQARIDALSTALDVETDKLKSAVERVK